MTIEPLADVKANLSKYVDAAEQHHQRTVITRNGRPAAVLLGVTDLESIEETLSVLSDSAVLAELNEANAAWAAGEFSDLADVRSALSTRVKSERDRTG